MGSRLYNVTVDAHDPRALAEFWRQVLDYRVAFDQPDEVGIEPPDNDAAPAISFAPFQRRRSSRTAFTSTLRLTIKQPR
jgi:hypothetical protein